ncbi:MAG: flagellar export chaperone FliS [Gammaproteobacteria bacterium]|nr:flagellar export chaperone FliS [Gammaproteobacteria bacterium]
MKHSDTGALGHYRSVGAYGAAAAADRQQLIQQMMAGAHDRIATARGHMQRGETAAKGEAICKAVALIDGLRTSLDLDKGGEIAANLNALYDYMTRRLTEANVQNRPELLDEVAGLLAEIRSAWEQLPQQAPEPA